MARHIGLKGASARLEKVEDESSDFLETKLWVGQTRYLPPVITKQNLSYTKKTMFAVAGAVAECRWRRESFEEILDWWYGPDSMSDSDWAACECKPGNPTRKLLQAIEMVFSLFDRQTGKLWPKLLLEARWLIEDSRAAT